ncbi:hypothetical protein FJV41_23825 [Myxococcus llanfairpwllgwyngyllgogerychwyrndrobwllllantysiliogogogochensis]|uniref:Uncharacterized protein n=1 Tax=Myxococcus llanfairpwllgwyngyllgogerychwyrndrobwllllantysiliogogogochensis TaxID=2590453 RepID=A0A540WWQ3_9BACT|nr:hypothetical protein [Myxococcus llanfairpwllgwyngyllgogerychwyrndrobwllllantysiliogogogochensis]TQF13422.1 hypothetical protein FJV41_23825 [Myxococcus llanfairpwllgwyngyllgogerychwyrndrobwllllantysiliogogogochensis]
MSEVTAIQLREEATLSCSLFYGAPYSQRRGHHGPIALFGANAIVGYLVVQKHRPRCWVLRTWTVGAEGELLHIPGVYPDVTKLIEVNTWGRVDRLRSLFEYLKREGVTVEQLPDSFFLRVAAVLGGRLPSAKVLPSLLSR